MPASRLIISAVTLLLLGALLLACAFGVIPYVIKQMLEANMKLTPDSEGYSTWLNTPAPVYINFYFFNVTNAEQFLANSTIRPHVKQIGPYVYREMRNKTDVERINGGATLRYRQHKWYVFDANKSCGSENDMFTTINIPLVTIASYLNYSSHSLKVAADLAVECFGQHLFEKFSVSHLLWGYHPTFPFIIQELLKRLHLLHLLPTWGIYVGATANGTDDGEYEIDTGQTDISQLGHITSWRNSRSLSFWTDPNCNMINGTDGTFWHPMVSKSETLYIFNSDLCRSVYITSDGSESVVAGVTTYRFRPPPSVFADPSQNEDNRGFCTPANNCLRAGVLNVTSCRGAPIVLSEPHFYQADPLYQHAVDGLSPNDSCLTYVDVEPYTGYVLKAEKKIQVNVYLQKTEVIRDTKHLENDLIFPVMWLNENVVIGDDTGDRLNSQVIHVVYVAYILEFCLFAVGLLFVVAAAVLFTRFLYLRCCHSGSGHVVKSTSPAAAAAADDEDAQLIDAGSA